MSALLMQSLPLGSMALLPQSLCCSIFPTCYSADFGLMTLCLQTSILLLEWVLLGGNYHQHENRTLSPLFPLPLTLQILVYSREKTDTENSKLQSFKYGNNPP